MSEYAYSLGQVTPAELVSNNNTLITDLITRDHDVNVSPANLDQWSNTELNNVTTFRTRRLNSRPSRWYFRNFAGDTFQYIVDPGNPPGDVYEITQSFEFITYASARRQARTELGEYYRAFVTSQFTAAGFTFLADVTSTVSYLVINTIVLRDDAGAGYPVGAPQFVFDIDGLEFEVLTTADWEAFYNKYVGLFDDAREATNDAWTAVQAASLTSEVEIIMDNLPTIPGQDPPV